MDMNRITGALFSGFMCKLYAAALAVYMGVEAVSYVRHAFGMVSKGFGG